MASNTKKQQTRTSTSKVKPLPPSSKTVTSNKGTNNKTKGSSNQKTAGPTSTPGGKSEYLYAEFDEALKKALKENEDLKEEVEKLRSENKRLKGRNASSPVGADKKSSTVDRNEHSLQEKIQAQAKEITELNSRNEKDLKEKEELKEEVESLKKENIMLKERNGSRDLKEKEELKEEVESLKKENIMLKERNGSRAVKEKEELKEEVESLKKENKLLKERNGSSVVGADRKNSTIDNKNEQSLQEEIRAQKEKISELKSGNEKFKKELSNCLENIKSESQKVLQLEESHDKIKKDLDAKEKQLKQLTGNPGEKEKVILKLQEEVNALKNRISKIAGARLSDNNPGITDLSDPYRALKLGEMFSELYDNEWTDAMEELEPIEGEAEAIKTLLKIVQASYNFCSGKSKQYFDDMTKALALFNGMTSEEISTEVSKGMKDYRKSLALHVMGALQNEFCMGETGSKYKDSPKTNIYQRRCVAVCWFMTVQDPPVYIDCSIPTRFDDDKYKAYTKKGKQVDFLVWPALLLHKGGSLMGKGVIQGKS